MAPNIPAVVAKLQAHLAALGDGRDARSENERIAYGGRYATTQGLISALGDKPVQLARLQARIDDLDARRVAVLAKETEFETAIAGFADWRTVADARERDKEWERQRETRRGLERLREGSLLQAPGVVFERLDDLDARIAELTRRRDALQSALNAHLKTAEQLLAAPVAS
jgi:hypothetical protein